MPLDVDDVLANRAPLVAKFRGKEVKFWYDPVAYTNEYQAQISAASKQQEEDKGDSNVFVDTVIKLLVRDWEIYGCRPEHRAGREHEARERGDFREDGSPNLAPCMNPDCKIPLDESGIANRVPVWLKTAMVQAMMEDVNSPKEDGSSPGSSEEGDMGSVPNGTSS